MQCCINSTISLATTSGWFGCVWTNTLASVQDSGASARDAYIMLHLLGFIASLTDDDPTQIDLWQCLFWFSLPLPVPQHPHHQSRYLLSIQIDRSHFAVHVEHFSHCLSSEVFQEQDSCSPGAHGSARLRLLALDERSNSKKASIKATS